MSDEMKVQAKGLNKKFIFIAIALIAVGLVAALVLLLPTSAKAKKVDEQLDLGAKYLSELDYEQAIVAYEAVIKIDPKCEEAYLALADIYIATGAFEKAEEVLKRAEEEIGSDVTDAVSGKKKEVVEVREEQKAKQKKEEQLAVLTPIPTNTPIPSPTELPTPTVTPSPTPTNTPIPSPTELPTPTVTPSPIPTNTPIPSPTATPIPIVVMEETPESAFRYTVADGKVTITSVIDRTLETIRVPKEIEGYPVTSIGTYAFSDCSNLTTIEIPDSVTSIGYGAFNNCSSLTSIKIPDSVIHIGTDVFNGCNSLKSIYIPKNVATFSYYQKANSGVGMGMVSSLQEFIVAEENAVFASENGVLYLKDKSKLVKVPQGYKGSFTIPDTVTEVCGEAFENCTGITEIVIQNHNLKINAGNDTFVGCTSLERFVIDKDSVKNTADGSVYNVIDGVLFKDSMLWVVPPKAVGSTYSIPDSTTSIDYWAFSICADVKKVHIPKGVTGKSAWNYTYWNDYTYNTAERNYFYGCNSLEGISVDPENNDYMEKDGVLFSKDGTVLVSFPTAYKGSSYRVPEGVGYIAPYAFANSALQNATLSGSVKEILPFAFAHCSKLTEIVIPNGVQTIGVCAYEGCSSLSSVSLSDSLNAIHDYAFTDNDNLKSIYIPESVTILGSGVFDNSIEIIAHQGSAAEAYAKANGLAIQYP